MFDGDFFGAMGGMPGGLSSAEGKRFGVDLAKIIDLKDPKELGRVKCEFVTAEDNVDETEWAYVAAPFAGQNSGMFFHPRVGDFVLLAYEDGDIHVPYVIGSVWWKGGDAANEPPVKINADNEASNIYKITTPSGNTITVIETKDEEKIEITSTGGKIFRLDDKNKKIELLSKEGDGITFDTEQSVISIKCKEFKVDAEGNTFNLSAQGAAIDTKAAVSIKGGSEVTAEASGNATIKGVALNLEASGVANLKGSMVKIG